MSGSRISVQTIAVATNTYYPRWYSGKIRSVGDTEKIRGDLALEFFERCQRKGIPAMVVDAGSNQSFIEPAAKYGCVKVFVKKNLRRSPSRRLAIRAASALPGVRYIVLTEPEKVSLLTDCLDPLLEFLESREVDLLIPQRQADLYKKTYPSYMYRSEVEANRLANEYLRSHNLLTVGRNFDIFFGPRILRNEREIVRLFMKRFRIRLADFELPFKQFGPEEYSDTGIFPIVLALKAGLRVESLELPFRYPHLQKENEEIGDRNFFEEKRKAQRLSVLVELIHFLAYLERSPGSRLESVA